MKKLILPAMIAFLTLAVLTTRAQVRVDVHIGVPVPHPVPVRPLIVGVRPVLRPPVVVVRPARPVVAAPVVLVRPSVPVVRPVRRVVVYR